MVVPTKFAAAFQQAVTIYRQGRLEDAEALCRKVLKADARHTGALHLLGIIQLRTKKPAGAVESFSRLLKLQPASADVLNNRAMALHDLGRNEEALADLEKALALRPDYREALNNRGGLQFSLRRYGEAARSYARLLELAPEPRLLGCLLRSRMGACDWTDFDKLTAEIAERVARGEPADEPVSFTWHSLSPALQLRCTEDYIAHRYRREALPPGARDLHERIRVAYLSSDFREHPISYLLVNLFERHDRDQFEVIGLSIGPDDKSPMRARLEKVFDRFLDLRALSNLEIAQLIRRESVDILVDLVGVTSGNRAQVLAHRPAPIQANFQGFPMGAALIDYTFSDDETTPDRLRDLAFREQVVRLPDTWVTTDTTQAIAEVTPSRAAEGLPGSGFVFCCFNTPYKITPAVFSVWMRLLKAVEGSILWLRHDNEDARANLLKEAQRQGVESARVIFARRVSLPDHLARHRLADLFVDTFPYGAHTTATHALWAGLPVLALRGDTFVSRVSASNVRAAGLPELVVDSLGDYEALAFALARDPARLATLREKLASERSIAPLFDSERHRRHVEQAYLQMMERYRRGEPPASFDVAPID